MHPLLFLNLKTEREKKAARSRLYAITPLSNPEALSPSPIPQQDTPQVFILKACRSVSIFAVSLFLALYFLSELAEANAYFFPRGVYHFFLTLRSVLFCFLFSLVATPP